MLVKKDFKFYDTSSLLIAGDKVLKEERPIAISSVTLSELEHIKTSANKSIDIKISASHLTKLINENPSAFNIIVFTEDLLEPIKEKNLPINNDSCILATAIAANEHDDLIFVTNDICLKNIANLFFGDKMIQSEEYQLRDSLGYTKMIFSDEDLSRIYMGNNTIRYENLINNEYCVAQNSSGEVIDCFLYKDGKLNNINYYSFKSDWIGEIKPKDVYQRMAMHSLVNNQVTLLTGKPGSGKSILSVSYMLQQLEKGEVDRLYFACNPVAVRGAARLGFYPGTREDKLLDSQIGNFLIGKLGSLEYVENLVLGEKIMLLPVADCRGIDIGSDSKTCLYVTEAQNLSVDLMKLILQRAGKNCQVILDGDTETQLDLIDYAGPNNGLIKVSNLFKGEDCFGQIDLKNIYRSEVAAIADKL